MSGTVCVCYVGGDAWWGCLLARVDLRVPVLDMVEVARNIVKVSDKIHNFLLHSWRFSWRLYQ